MYYRNVGGMSIRGQSGPATVLLSNLDPTANAEDIRVSVVLGDVCIENKVLTGAFPADMFTVWTCYPMRGSCR